MTDTVNVPRERIEAFLKAWVSRSGNGNIIYGMGMEDDVLELTVSDLRAILAAAPKAEPNERGVAGAVMDALWPILGGNHTSAEMWAEIGEAVSSAINAQPEAPKVEQELNSYQRSDAMLYGAPNKIQTHPAPASVELLEALKPFAEAAVDLDDEETGHIWERPSAMSIDVVDLRRAAELYDKHKGPQS